MLVKPTMSEKNIVTLSKLSAITWKGKKKFDYSPKNISLESEMSGLNVKSLRFELD